MRLEANPDYWGGAPKVDEVIFQLYTNPDTMVAGSQARDHRRSHQRAFGAVQAARLRARPRGEQRDKLAVHRARHELLREPGLHGQPVLLDPEFRKARQLGRGPREGRLGGDERLRHRGLHAHRAVLQVPLGAACGQPVHLRSGEGQASCSMRPATRTSTATASARPRTARSSACASTPPRIRPRTRRPASSSSAGSETSASSCSSRWWTPAPDRRAVQLQGRHLRPRLGHVHLVLDPGRRPAIHAEHLHARADRGLERLPVDRPRVHEAERAAVADHRRGSAQADRRPACRRSSTTPHPTRSSPTRSSSRPTTRPPGRAGYTYPATPPASSRAPCCTATTTSTPTASWSPRRRPSRTTASSSDTTLIIVIVVVAAGRGRGSSPAAASRSGSLRDRVKQPVSDAALVA